MSSTKNKQNNNVFKWIKAAASENKFGIDDIVSALLFALEKAFLKEYPTSKCEFIIDMDNENFVANEIKTVVEDSENLDDDIEISIQDAQKIDKNYQVNDVCKIPIDIDLWEKRIVLHVKQIFIQKLTEINNKLACRDWIGRVNTNIRAEVEKFNFKTGQYEIILDNNTKTVLQKNEQIINEKLEPGLKYYFYLKSVNEQSSKWPIVVSRSDVGLVINLLKDNIPEINEGKIEIKAIYRMPGYKTKIALKSNVDGIDPIGTCVGQNGDKIKTINALINNEFVDVILWDEDWKQFIVNACAPEKIIGIEVEQENKTKTSSDASPREITLIVDDESFPKIIGKEGKNIRLISKLTNIAIDVVKLSIAKEDLIEYEDISHLVAKGNKYLKNKINLQKNLINNKNHKYSQQPNNFINQENKQSKNLKIKPVILQEEISDTDIDEILKFSTKTNKKEEVNLTSYDKVNFDDDIFMSNKTENSSKKNSSGPKYKKAKPKSQKNETNYLYDFDDITIDYLDNDDSQEVEISDNVDLLIDEEEKE